MLYALQDYTYHAATPMRLAALMARSVWGAPGNPLSKTEFGRTMFAGADLFANVTRRYGKPEWRIDSVVINGKPVRVRQTTTWSSPWCKMIHFSRDIADMRQAGRKALEPAVLIVAPLSGHYATLLRGTVETFLQNHEVYITDWVNAREVPLLEGRFDFHDFVDHVKTMVGVIGPRAHVVAVCQPGPPAMAAAALLAEDNSPARPASVTLMGWPIDARLAPTAANALAQERPFAWFSNNMIHTVPAPYAGALRRVYPGFVQLYSFMSMNAERHRQAHWAYYEDLVKGDGDAADKHLEFYDEYLSVLDLTEEFYLQTIDYVFQRHLLPKGELEHRGRKVDLSKITDVAVMTVEGENDDISGVGQTQAVHSLLTNLPGPLHELYVQPKVGHYGVFNGRRFDNEIYPRIRDFIARADVAVEAGLQGKLPANANAAA